jgi:hypothetical protein
MARVPRRSKPAPTDLKIFADCSAESVNSDGSGGIPQDFRPVLMSDGPVNPPASKVMAMSVLVSGVALDEVMVGDLCGEEVAHVVRILLDRCMAACDWDAKRT